MNIFNLNYIFKKNTEKMEKFQMFISYIKLFANICHDVFFFFFFCFLIFFIVNLNDVLGLIINDKFNFNSKKYFFLYFRNCWGLFLLSVSL